MKKSKILTGVAVAFIATIAIASSAFADSLAYPGSNRNDGKRVRYVKLTGSMIPQKIVVKSIGTATYSNLRVIGRREIDQTGRFTTAGVLAQDPALTVIGF